MQRLDIIDYIPSVNDKKQNIPAPTLSDPRVVRAGYLKINDFSRRKDIPPHMKKDRRTNEKDTRNTEVCYVQDQHGYYYLCEYSDALPQKTLGSLKQHNVRLRNKLKQEPAFNEKTVFKFFDKPPTAEVALKVYQLNQLAVENAAIPTETLPLVAEKADEEAGSKRKRPSDSEANATKKTPPADKRHTEEVSVAQSTSSLFATSVNNVLTQQNGEQVAVDVLTFLLSK